MSAKHTFVEEEILAMLDVEGAPAPLVARVKQRVQLLRESRNLLTDEGSQFVVSSGYGHTSKKGFVLLEIDNLRWQMTPKKALEVAGMLGTAAEAGISDEIVMELMRKSGINDPNRLGQILLLLREIRQGQRTPISASPEGDPLNDPANTP